MEREKQWMQLGLFLHIQAKIKEDLKEIIVNEVSGIVKKVLREEDKDLKEIIEVLDIVKKVLREEGRRKGKSVYRMT
ncbi:hypothetical protein H5410_038881 [Solanum commersonii]|uniref:Uncharacterized protein n=1 Tax=Solanum commersonii TaxID=4109 RepID=A0A9J5YBD4_SOLCO|nr:hypothetical protein H5410_038881 [Solanum commersonii]